MKYIYSPIYKYLLSFIIIYLFFYHQFVFNNYDLLINSLLITFLFMILDNIMIEKHEKIYTNMNSSKLFNEAFEDLNNELDDELNDDTLHNNKNTKNNDINMDDIFEDEY